MVSGKGPQRPAEAAGNAALPVPDPRHGGDRLRQVSGGAVGYGSPAALLQSRPPGDGRHLPGPAHRPLPVPLRRRRLAGVPAGRAGYLPGLSVHPARVPIRRGHPAPAGKGRLGG